MTPSILGYLKVLDLTNEQGWLCGKILTDMGAEVIRIQKPGESIADCYANRGKYLINLDYISSKGRNLFLRLIEKSDVLIESLKPGFLADLGLDFGHIRPRNPRLIMASISPFGQSGPYCHFESSELVSAAMGGQVFINGEPGRPPLQPPVPLASSLACLNAAAAILAAILQRHISNKGQYLDISIQKCVSDALDHVMVRYNYLDEIAIRSGPFNWNRSMRIFPCKDGYILLSLFHRWETLVEWLHSEDMAADLTDTKYIEENERSNNLEHIVKVLEKWTLNHTVDELVETGQAMHFPWGKVNSLQQVIEDTQLNARGYFVTVKEGDKEYKFPGAPVQMGGSPWKVNAKLLSSEIYNREVYYHRLGLNADEMKKLASEGVIELDGPSSTNGF